LSFERLLRLEFETVGNGMPAFPLTVYEVYLLEGLEYNRWVERMRLLSAAEGGQFCGNTGAPELYHVVLASSLHRGFGINEHLNGIELICQSVKIDDVTAEWAHSPRYPSWHIESSD